MDNVFVCSRDDLFQPVLLSPPAGPIGLTLERPGTGGRLHVQNGRTADDLGHFAGITDFDVGMAQIDPLKRNIQKIRGVYNAAIFLILGFMFVVQTRTSSVGIWAFKSVSTCCCR